jgi:dCMP deaminase
MHDDPMILEDRELKYSCIIHAEENALLFARRDLTGCTIYTYPVPPCGACASKIRQSGITRVVAPWSSDEQFQERWEASLAASEKVFYDVVRLDLVDPEELGREL